mmetsp:Transcript_109296/g.314792  ORF Transcript_109296/g.314792 Transcript_109296/m.314792 type:complete len:200 (-) Transcript_109296:30-629(-)
MLSEARRSGKASSARAFDVRRAPGRRRWTTCTTPAGTPSAPSSALCWRAWIAKRAGMLQPAPSAGLGRPRASCSGSCWIISRRKSLTQRSTALLGRVMLVRRTLCDPHVDPLPPEGGRGQRIQTGQVSTPSCTTEQRWDRRRNRPCSGSASSAVGRWSECSRLSRCHRRNACVRGWNAHLVGFRLRIPRLATVGPRDVG